jgi:hypothetical protein
MPGDGWSRRPGSTVGWSSTREPEQCCQRPARFFGQVNPHSRHKANTVRVICLNQLKAVKVLYNIYKNIIQLYFKKSVCRNLSLWKINVHKTKINRSSRIFGQLTTLWPFHGRRCHCSQIPIHEHVLETKWNERFLRAPMQLYRGTPKHFEVIYGLIGGGEAGF